MICIANQWSELHVYNYMKHNQWNCIAIWEVYEYVFISVNSTIMDMIIVIQ